MRAVNLTVKFESNEEALRFEKWLNQYVEITDFVLLPDTKELYEKDTTFKKLTNEYYKAKKLRNDYINEYNFSQNK